MKLVVLGASGGVGRELVAQAAKRGHEVVAVARASSDVKAPEGVKVLRGDLTNEAFLREAVRGADAVASALGHRLKGIGPWNKPEQPAFLRDSTTALVAAMKAEGVKRVIAVSSGGVGDSAEVVPAFFRVFVSMSALKTVFAALEEMERLYLESGLDACVVRPTGLTDEPPTGKVVVAKRMAGRATIPRADVAGYLLDQLGKAAFDERTPLVTVTGAG
jgi:putative NADH-flavin reductase